jgi:hypothetical protein
MTTQLIPVFTAGFLPPAMPSLSVAQSVAKFVADSVANYEETSL